MSRIYPVLIFILVVTINQNNFTQIKTNPAEIKAQKIKSVTKVSTDLKATADFTPQVMSTITYDKDGNQSEHIKFSRDGSIEIKYTYLYDDRGNNIEVTGTLPDGSIGNKWIYHYNENNNLVRQTSYRPDGQIGRDYIFSYDEDGIRQSELIYDSKQLIEQSEYIYEFYDIEN